MYCEIAEMTNNTSGGAAPSAKRFVAGGLDVNVRSFPWR
jgi:hypothetical protein